MKLRILLDPNDDLRKELESLGITDDESSEYILTRKNMSVNFIQVKKDDRLFYIDVSDIVYIESLGHDVYVHTADDNYVTRERLKQLEKLLDPEQFLRVSSSAIINTKQIKQIEASIFQKFILHMQNGARVDVTRSYYYIFKDRFNI